jgi:hypothetical protein
MRHERHYTLAEANAIRDWVAQRVRRVQQASSQLVGLGYHTDEALSVLDEHAGGAFPGPEAARPLLELSLALGELGAVEVVLRDVDRGLVDFPAMRNGDEIYLCWLVEEEEIRFWHEPDAGYAGRQPL